MSEGRRPDGPELREALAAQQHEIWAHWMRYLFSVSVKCPDGSFVITPEYASRWQRQMDTAYNDLSGREKESDRHQADKILAVLPPPVAAPEPDWSQAPEWATHHVFCGDAEGLWIKTDGEPTVEEHSWAFNSREKWTDWLPSDLTLPLGIDWRTTLRRRPEARNE